MTALVDHLGRPLRRDLLVSEVAGPTISGARTPQAGYPADGLTPARLGELLKEADAGEPLRFFELAEILEERDLHYAGVLGTRKRSVAQITVTVEAASDDAEDERRAEMVRDWLKRDELADETFDILDAIGKGISFTEIIWDSSMGQFWPARLAWRDLRWFTFHRQDLATPLLRGGLEGHGQPSPLPGFKFITANFKAKSGLPVRGGIARLAAWAWMFKKYTERDWAIFTQTYGQPVRLGKFHPGASKEDRATLMRAVANIAGDCAAIIPTEMEIEFIQADNLNAGSTLYRERADWFDQQVSKAVLGQTTTTDAISGGHAVSREHRQVQEDIERSDCLTLAATLNRDLIRPWMDLNFGPPAPGRRNAYPRLVIARPEQEDLKLLAESLGVLVPLGLQVGASQVRDKFGLAKPAPGDDLLLPPAGAPVGAPVLPGLPGSQPPPALQSQQMADQSAQEQAVHHPATMAAVRAARAAQPVVDGWVDQIEGMLAQAGSLEDFMVSLETAYANLDPGTMPDGLAEGMAAMHAAGRFDAHEESAPGTTEGAA